MKTENLKQLCTFTVPWMAVLSKNYRYVSRTKKVLNPRHVQARRIVELSAKTHRRKFDVLAPKTKIYLSLTCYKPDYRGDAHNILDDFLDATAQGIGINDRYFVVELDWKIEKKNPRVVCEIFIEGKND